MKACPGAICCYLVAMSAQAQLAQEPVVQAGFSQPGWELVVGPFAVHFSNEDDHSSVFLLGLERNQSDNVIWGLSVFRNSFGQTSAYAYYGYRWDGLFGNPAIYAKLSGGIIYGYKYPYEDKVPFNHNGFGLGIIPAIGYRLTPNDALQVGALGTAGLIFTYNRKF
ncbi:ABC transporter ATP-binding protein [Variovorax sp. J22P168]|uniref:ABC transporter ATP-binding protein n=1 Tax=Variovorax jilinensis TaxID=3053513 RepID=UPI002576D36D|nr:ABC transporter ATP-binding protein [Variovorax sp. J22P168]MDM0011170.1 ABC transporter ATP-binding protein [Variovorax sp. J22P168]